MNYEFSMTSLAVGLSILMVAWVWRERMRRDDLRCDLRGLRDDLFMYVAKNGHSFKSPGYIEAREGLNNLIQASNQLSVPRFVMTLVMHARLVASGRKTNRVQPSNDAAFNSYLEQVRAHAEVHILHFLFLEGLTGFFVKNFLRAAGGVQSIGKAKARVTKMGTEFVDAISQLDGGHGVCAG